MGARRKNVLRLLGVGVQLAGGGGIVYLLRDDFTTAEAAPLASPRTASHVGTLTLVQTDGEFSISGGKLNFSAQTTPAWGDLAAYSALQSRAAGRAVVGKLTPSSTYAMLGWDANQASVVSEGIYFTDTNNLAVWLGATAPIVATWAQATEYRVAGVMRATGAFMLIKGGTYSEWTLLWVEAAATGSRYATFLNYQATGTLDTFRVRDLPAPFDTDYGLATDRKAGAVSAGATFTHTADCVIEWTQTTRQSAGVTQVWFRQQDANNYWEAQITSSGELSLYEVVGSSYTQRGAAVGVVSSGHRIVIVADGSTIRGYSNNVLRWTYSSASNFAVATSGRLQGLGTGGAVSDLVTWPRTLSGAAATILDQSVA